MTSLYIDRRDARLEYDAGQLRIREAGGGPPRGIPLHSLERVLISGNVEVETRLLTHLADNGTSVLIIEGRGARRFAHLHGGRHGDALRRLGQYRLCTTPALRLRCAQMLVRSRASSMRGVLLEALDARPDLRKELFAGIETLSGLIPRVRCTLDRPSLRGTEGAIAATWFRAYTPLFADTLNFTHRNRRPPRDGVNAALSLGYTLTQVEAVRACLFAGLDPLLGVLHEPEHGRDSLACDLNELVRHHVERLVWRLFAEKILRPESFDTHNGGVQLKKGARELFYGAFEKTAAAHRRRLRRTAGLLARFCQQLAPSSQDLS